MKQLGSIQHAIQKDTYSITSFWGCSKNHRGFAPHETSKKLDSINFENIIYAVDTLKLNDGDVLSKGDLIMLWSMLGAIVEWYAKFIIIVYDHNYVDNPKKNRVGKTLESSKLNFELALQILESKEFSLGIYGSEKIRQIQKYRNAIHLMDNRNIGTKEEYVECLQIVQKLVDEIVIRLP